MAVMDEIGILQTMVQSLEKQIQENEKRLGQLNDELQNWRRQAHAHCPACGNRSLKTRKHRDIPFSEMSIADAVIMTLLEYDYPINTRTLRLKLEEKGYPKEKLGRYANRLHTVIWRLTDAGRIRREEGDEIIVIR